MRTRSSTSSVATWPDRGTVDRALRSWADDIRRRHPELLRVGCFGSFARGDWGFGSDLDILVVVETSDAPFERRAIGWGTETLPVPTDILILTNAEFQRAVSGRRFAQMIAAETRWLYERSPSEAHDAES